MDVYDDQLGQIHDFNPGIAPSGLFWTMLMNPANADVNPGNGRAIYQATNLPVRDYHEIGNSLTGGPSVPGSVSFHIEWAPSQDKHHYRYAPNQWVGDFVKNTAMCSWSGRTATAEFHTDTDNPVIYAEVGKQRSGVFFS
jgi:hypothetical protein